MTEHPHEDDSAGREAPPTEYADELGLIEPPGWPKVVGIVSIVWASLGLLCSVCGVASLAMMPQMLKGAEQQLGPMPDVMKPDPAQMIMAVVGMIGPVLLLIAGILTLSRKPAGRTLHLVYAGVSLVLGMIGGGLAVRHQLAVEAWAAANSADPWAKQASSPFAWIGIVFGVGISLLWPVFCLCWFGLAKKRPEEGYSDMQVV